MIFNTFEPYDIDYYTIHDFDHIDIKKKTDNINVSDNSYLNNDINDRIFDYENECFICMESTTNNKSKLIELVHISTFKKNCKCNALVHIYCFNKWVNIKCICPICRITMDRNNDSNNSNISNSFLRYNSFEIEYINDDTNNHNNNYILLIKVSYYMWVILFIVYSVYYICLQFNLYI